MGENISQSMVSSDSDLPTPIYESADFDPCYDWSAELARLEASEPFSDTVVPETPELDVVVPELARLEASEPFSDTVVPETPDLDVVVPESMMLPTENLPSGVNDVEMAEALPLAPNKMKIIKWLLGIYFPLLLTLPEFQDGMT